jgi:isopentenyl-diphosphate delta-isomerase
LEALVDLRTPDTEMHVCARVFCCLTGATSTIDTARETMTEHGQQLNETQLELMKSDECILVNEKDEEMGHASKEFCHLMKNIVDKETVTLHRAFSVFLFNEKGELLLQQRAAEKITFPLYWTNTCCSHPLYNPEYDERETRNQLGIRRAAQRKLEHELGIAREQTHLEQYQFMTRILYMAPFDETWGEHEVDYCLMYQYHTPGAITLNINKNEVEEVKFVNKQKLIEMMNDSSLLFTPWFKLIAHKFLFEWWDALLGDKLQSLKDVNSIHNMLL